MQHCTKIYYSMFVWSSTCFWRHTAHHQELKNCTSSLWFSIHERLLDIEVYNLSHMQNHRLRVQFWAPDNGQCVAQNMSASYKHGIINFDTLLHLVGYFCMNHKVILKGIFKYHYYYNKKSLNALHLYVITMFTIQIIQCGLLFYLYMETTFLITYTHFEETNVQSSIYIYCRISKIIV
jgi:hypothetical protein